jgi:hypothetical protein
LTKLKEEICGITEEMLADESDITHINNFIYAADNYDTDNQPSKRSKNRINENFWK